MIMLLQPEKPTIIFIYHLMALICILNIFFRISIQVKTHWQNKTSYQKIQSFQVFKTFHLYCCPQLEKQSVVSVYLLYIRRSDYFKPVRKSQSTQTLPLQAPSLKAGNEQLGDATQTKQVRSNQSLGSHCIQTGPQGPHGKVE